MRTDYLIALIGFALLTLLSLMFNAMTIVELMWWRQYILTEIADTRAIVRGMGEDTISYTFEVDQDIPVAARIPVSQEITVPINTTVPVDAAVIVPINLGLTTYNMTVPVSTVFPIDMEITVPVSQTVDIVTTVPMDIDVPIEIVIADTPLVGFLDEVDATLADVATQLNRFVWQR
ncbi:MAG: hypothetical protein PVG71_01465 [Anaerolineae bacterium]|jgi:hypothetical protein